jgi:hypothetical protein
LEPSWPIVVVQAERDRAAVGSGIRRLAGRCTARAPGGLSAAARARRTGGGVPRAACAHGTACGRALASFSINAGTAVLSSSDRGAGRPSSTAWSVALHLVQF